MTWSHSEAVSLFSLDHKSIRHDRETPRLPALGDVFLHLPHAIGVPGAWCPCFEPSTVRLEITPITFDRGIRLSTVLKTIRAKKDCSGTQPLGMNFGTAQRQTQRSSSAANIEPIFNRDPTDSPEPPNDVTSLDDSEELFDPGTQFHV